MKLTLEEVAARLDAQVEGDPSTVITGASWRLDEARAGDLVRIDDPRWLPEAEAGPAAALILPLGAPPPSKPALRVTNPQLTLARALGLFHPPFRPSPGIDPSAVVSPSAEVAEDATVMALCSIGARARIGHGVVLHPQVVIGDEVVIGDDSELFPHVSIYAGTRVGARVRIHSGAVIGADGFGYVRVGRSHEKIPQVGAVEIGDDVEIGANTTIDRATTGVTRIGAGTKIDNQVQIGHNVQMGASCIIIAQVGIAGSVIIEDQVVIAGQAGVKEHVRIGAGSVVAGQSAVFGDLPPGSNVSGYPARPHREQLQVQASAQRLPALQRAVRALERQLRRISSADKDVT